MNRHTFTTSLLMSLLLVVLPTQAQSPYPTKAVKLMVGAGPGGGTDIIARMLAEKFADGIKGTWVVENKPGASNTIAADITAKAAPDGHTLLVATNTGQAIAPHLMKLGFDPIKDLIPIGLIVTVPNVLVVGAQVPVNNVADLVKAMKAKPGDFKYGSSGVGSTQHIAGEAFDVAAGTKSEHISYKGSSQAHLDIIGGSIQMMFDTTSSAMSQIKSGKFRPLAVTTPMRSPQLPDVPTLAETGIRGADMSTWYGLYVTAGTPQEVVTKLQQELARILKLPEVEARLKGLGGEPGAISTAQFGELNRQEHERFGKLIRETGIKLQ
jgi:tripartite-type tricarboxylate transporter receptor subunit TctC